MIDAVVDRVSRFLGSRVSRRSFLVRSTYAATALAVAPKRYALQPGTAYEALCFCAGACGCGSACCAGYSEFCCSINGSGANWCPEGAFIGGWWAAANSSYCNNSYRYYLDCHASCHCDTGCGGGFGFCDTSCDGQNCHCAFDSCDNWVTGCFQFRYGQCNQQISCAGRIICRVVSCVPPWEVDPTCTRTWNEDDYTAEMTAPCATYRPEPPKPTCPNPKTRCEVVSMALTPEGGGFWAATSWGLVRAHGGAAWHGDVSGKHLDTPIVAIAPSNSGKGYWLLAAGGRVFPFGDAGSFGSALSGHAGVRVTGMARVPHGGGYWIVDEAGAVFHFGSAAPYGGLRPGETKTRIVGIAATPSGRGYWLAGENGAVFPFGDAGRHGGAKDRHPAPIVAIASLPPAGGTSSPQGYHLLADDGAMYHFGAAKGYGNPKGNLGSWPAVSLASTPDGKGYYVIAASARIFGFGDARHIAELPA